MPIGDAVIPTRRARGFTYLWLLLAIAMAGAGLAALGQQWTTLAQREREVELIFRGRQIAAAIASFRGMSPGASTWPTSLEALIEDRRGSRAVHHLRRLYADPFTQKADWLLIVDERGGIQGVSSRSPVPALLTSDLAPSRAGAPIRVSDRLFLAPLGAVRAAIEPAVAASNVVE